MSNNRTKAVAFASAQNVSAADELLDSLVAFQPLETKSIETKHGISEATIARVIKISDDGEPTDLGEVPVFWSVVRRQLSKASPEVPWIAGRLVQSGPAYRLELLTEEETAVVRRALLASV